jgi:UDP-N-acetylglucosamine 2-epimerase (non-hydrolysing)
MKIAIILGTRPEIIKLSPIIRECERLHQDYFILHTGQHYSYNMDKVFFDQLKLPSAKYNLDVGSGTHGKQTGEMLIGIEKVLQNEKPQVVLVQGDTNSVLAGAIAAAKLHIKVGHVEAGLRSNDRRMPEEINRVLADHCSDFLFAPTEKSKQNLIREGIAEKKIFVVGNTIVDAVQQNLELAGIQSKVFAELGVEAGNYALATSHRQENVDDKQRFRGIVEGLRLVHNKLGLTIIFPIHPRGRKQLQTFDINTDGIQLTEPLSYLDFLVLESGSKIVLTDSGGVQEEACICHVPCVTLRDNTERPETLDVGSNLLAGTDPEQILKAAKAAILNSSGWVNPFGDGKASCRIIRSFV